MSLFRFIPLTLALLGGVIIMSAQAAVYPLPPDDVDLIGQVQIVQAQPEDTLLDIARRYSLGYEEIVMANPGVDRWLPGAGTEVMLPTRYILPNAPREGIVLNVSEMRVYYYPKPKPGDQPVVMTYPVSIGRMDWHTPLGTTKVVAKKKDPDWRPPESIKLEHAEAGDPLPDVVPAGPDNPLGQYALRLGIPGYLIHGTNRPYGIGLRVTHGCVRMYPEDIENLFPQVPVGTPVHIVNQHLKAGWLAGALFAEFHDPLEEQAMPYEVTFDEAMQALADKAGPYLDAVSPGAVRQVIEQASGLPVAITDH